MPAGIGWHDLASSTISCDTLPIFVAFVLLVYRGHFDVSTTDVPGGISHQFAKQTSKVPKQNMTKTSPLSG